MKFFGRFLAGAAALGIGLSFAACNFDSPSGGSSLQASALTYVAIDINPSVELLVRGGKVVGVKAGNDDASVLLCDEELTGLDVEEAAAKIVALADRLGYLTDYNKKVKITVLSDDAEEAKRLEISAKAGAQKGSDKAEVNSEPRVQDERTAKKLKEQDPDRYAELTAAKVRLIEAIMKYDPLMTYETGAEMTINELSHRFDQLIDEYKDMVTDGLEESFEAAYKAAKAELERSIAAVYGEEYLAAWEGYAALERAFEEIEDKAENASLSDEDVAAVMELLGISDRSLIEKGGVVRPDYVENYIDKHIDKHSDRDKEAAEALEDAVEEILDKYDEDNYLLTEEDLAALSEAAGETLNFVTLEDAEHYVEEKEHALERMEKSIHLTEAQREEIASLKEGFRNLKESIREEMKAEIEAVKEEIRRQKEERLG